VAAYLALHFIAAATAPAGAGAGSGYSPYIHAGSSIVQYLLPLAFLLAAAASFLRRSRTIFSFSRILVNPVSKVSVLSWPEFERLIVELFKERGFDVVREAPDADLGSSLVLTRGEERFLVQCKQWRAQQVGETVVRDLHAMVMARGASGGFVVTSGRFTRDAHQLAGGCNIELIDGVSMDEQNHAAGACSKTTQGNTQTGS
jgi:restriction system protein